MLLFHGTTEPALEGILTRGLRPPRPDATGHDWIWDLGGRAQGSQVFLSTSPVAGKGGDPVSFAMGWPARGGIGHYPGYIVVVDLPPGALNLVRGVVPNTELNSFISVSRTRSFLQETVRLEAHSLLNSDHQKPLARWTLSHWCLHYWLARYCVDHGIPLTAEALDAHLTLRLEHIDPALPDDLTPVRWQAFLEDYFRSVAFAYRDISSEAERERRRQTIARRYGVSLPKDFTEDEHRKYCPLCMRGLAIWAYHFDGFQGYQPMWDFLLEQPKKSGCERLPNTARLGSYGIPAPLSDGGMGTLQPLALRLRAILAHTKPFPDEEVIRFFRVHERSDRTPRDASWTWDEWYAAFLVDRCTLPHTWRPGHCRQFTARDLMRHDQQVIADAIPFPYILGAIQISDGQRLVPHLRPNRRKGETLSAKLWAMTHELRARYAGAPVVMD